jgi:hypothetical protein
VNDFRWKVLAASGYRDSVEVATTVEVVEGCLIFSDFRGAVAVYSPGTWRLVVRESDGRAVA